MIKILNLYAGIGGNRKLWTGDIEVTAVELDPNIAKIYQDFFPNDKVIVCDAHKYLLEHFKEYDFIWSSPPCPTHSRMRNLKNNIPEAEKKYPDMKLYEEIIFLSHFYKGKYCVENVISYYEPLIEPKLSNNHYFWTNFPIAKYENKCRNIRKTKDYMVRNMVDPELGLMVFKMAFKEQQKILFQGVKGE